MSCFGPTWDLITANLLLPSGQKKAVLARLELRNIRTYTNVWRRHRHAKLGFEETGHFSRRKKFSRAFCARYSLYKARSDKQWQPVVMDPSSSQA